MDIDKKPYDKVAELIHRDKSPAEIEAKRTHVIVINEPTGSGSD